MADEIERPLSEFCFLVRFGDDTDATFQEMTGLQAETNAIEYRHGNSPSFTPIKMSALASAGTVTMKSGIFATDTTFFARYQETQERESFRRRVVTITLLDEHGNPTVMWTLNNAWPTRVTGAEVTSDGNNVAVKSIDIAYETLAMKSV